MKPFSRSLLSLTSLLQRALLPLAFASAGLAWPQLALAKQGHSHGAHVHGLAKADVAVQGAMLSVQLQVPLDSLLGFEHRPRSEAQRKAAQEAEKVFAQPAAWLKPDEAAQCKLTASEVNAEALQPAKPGAAKDDGAHADLEASYTFTCAAPDKLAAVDIGLATSFKRIQRIEVQVAGAQRQGKQTLRAPAVRVLLRR